MSDTISVLDAIGAQQTVMTNDKLAGLIGEVQASPTANTLLGRLLTLATLIGEVQASPTANTLLGRLKAATDLLATMDVDTGAMATLLGTIDADTGAMATLLGTIDADTAAMVVSLSAIQGLLTTIDVDTGAIATSAAASQASLAAIAKAVGGGFEQVAAAATNQALGATGAAGDYLASLLIIPATTSPGAVSINDGGGAISVFPGGADSVSNLVPFSVVLGAASVAGAWTVTTGADVSVVAFGSFT